jgi:outer membrane protein TolC
MKFKYIILLLIFPLFLSGLTLEEAEQIAQENNKDIKIAQEEKGMSFSNYKSIKGSLYPQLTLSGSYGLKKTDVPEILPAGSMAEKEMPLNTVLSMNQILFSSDVFNGLKAARVYNSINDTMLDITVRNVLFKTRRLFNSALLSKHVVEINEEALQIANAQYERVSNMFEQGLVSEYDKLRADLQVSQLQPQLQEAKNNYQLALQSLQNHLGDEVEIKEVEGQLSEPKMEEITLDYAIKEGLERRLELDASQLNVDILDIQYENQLKSYLPSIALNGSFTNFTSTNDYEVEADNFGNIYSLGIAFEMPLFTGFSNLNKAKEYKYQLKSARLETSVLYDNIKLEIKSNYLSLEKDKKNLVTAKRNKELASRGLEIAEQMYANQLGTYLDVQSAQLTYNQAQVNYISAVYSVINSYESLLNAMGKNFKS